MNTPSNTITITLPCDVTALVREEVQRIAQQAVDAYRQPDPQYTVPQVAEILNLDADTVRGYLKLAAGHPRRLRYVDATGTSFGRRVCLSEIEAWQDRNLARLPEELAPTLTRPANRRRSGKTPSTGRQ